MDLHMDVYRLVWRIDFLAGRVFDAFVSLLGRFVCHGLVSSTMVLLQQKTPYGTKFWIQPKLWDEWILPKNSEVIHRFHGTDSTDFAETVRIKP